MKTDRKSRTARKAPFLTSLALACAFMTGNAGAGIPVTDVGNMPNHIITQIQSYLNQLNTMTSKIQDATQYAREIQHMTQQLTSLDQMFASLGLTFMPIEKKSASELSAAITQRCNSSGGGFNPMMFLTEVLNLNGDIVAQQKTKCVQIVSLQFMQYNEQVALLKKAQDAQMKIDRLNTQLAGSNTNGKMDSNVGNATSIMSQLMLDAQYAETVIRTYEGMIKMVEEDQRQLAKRALKGESSMLGSMVSTAALATALEIAD
jgi:hypothetical protein